MVYFLLAAKVRKPFKIFFIKLLAGKKRLCIFALGFRGSNLSQNPKKQKLRFKDTSNEQKDVSTIEKKKKEQARIYGQDGFCKRKKSACPQKSERPSQADRFV